MNEKELTNILKSVSDEVFIKVIRQSKKRIQKIEKKEKQAIVDDKFRQTGISCSVCQSFKCVKNGYKNDK